MKDKGRLFIWIYLIFSLLQLIGCETEEWEGHERHEHREEERREHMGY